MYSAVITKSGQVTLPKELRDFLGVKPGEKIVFDRDEAHIIIKRKPSFEEYTAAINRNLSAKTKRIAKKSAGLTVSEMIQSYSLSAKGRADLGRRYGA